jgi:hypothetical protein
MRTASLVGVTAIAATVCAARSTPTRPAVGSTVVPAAGVVRAAADIKDPPRLGHQLERELEGGLLGRAEQELLQALSW